MGETWLSIQDKLRSTLEVTPCISQQSHFEHRSSRGQRGKKSVCPGEAISSQTSWKGKAFKITMKSKGSTQSLINSFVQRQEVCSQGQKVLPFKNVNVHTISCSHALKLCMLLKYKIVVSSTALPYSKKLTHSETTGLSPFFSFCNSVCRSTDCKGQN